MHERIVTPDSYHSTHFPEKRQSKPLAPSFPCKRFLLSDRGFATLSCMRCVRHRAHTRSKKDGVFTVAFANLIDLMSHERFNGWKYFAVTPEFASRCRTRLLEKAQYDFPVSMFDELERIKMTPVGEQEFLELYKKRKAYDDEYGAAFGGVNLKGEEKAKQEKQLGVAKVELTLSSADRDRLDAMRQARAVVGEPYTREEYIAELILQDEQRYQEQVAALPCCGKCKSSLPQGCDGVFEGDRACWRTRQYREDLML